MFRRIVRSLPILALTLAAAACEDSTSPGDPARLSVLLTDAPGAVAAVWVDVSEIYLQGGEEGRTTLLDEPTGLIELTELVGTTQTLVADAEIDAAMYAQLRVVLTAAVLETEDGDVYVMGDPELPEGLVATGELVCPSCGQSGLKIKIPSDELEVEEGESLALVLDFDVAQSFGHKAGASGKWVMHPVILGMMIEDANGDGIPDDSQSGSIEGTVVLDTDVTIPECPAGTPRGLDDFVPLATAQNLQDDDMNPIVRAGTTDAEGNFAIDFLQADMYDLGYQGQFDFEGASLLFTAEVAPTTADVNDDIVGGVVYTITATECQVSGG